MQILSDGYLEAAGIEASLVRGSAGMPTRTASEAAAALAVDDARVVKSLVFTSGAGVPLLVICCGTHRVDIASLAAAAGCKVVVGEEYRVIVDQTGKCVSADEARFTPSSRAVEVAAHVRRLVGHVTVGATYSKSGTGHWSASLSLPERAED